MVLYIKLYRMEMPERLNAIQVVTSWKAGKDILLFGHSNDVLYLIQYIENKLECRLLNDLPASDKRLWETMDSGVISGMDK